MELSIIIPARNEIFTKNTVEDILKNIEADTEVIVIMDGQWNEPGLNQHERVNIVKTGVAIGQRRATNLGVKLAKGKYIMKVDAHCSFDKGFDRIMIDGFKRVGDDNVIVPVMRNLWAFDWKCYKCGWKKYQSPTPEICPDCGRTDSIHRKMMWIGKKRPQSTSYCFDAEPHFQYFGEYKKRDEYKKMRDETGFTETMSLQGSCFMMTKELYMELLYDIDEKLGSWGNQGLEIACVAWLTGYKVLCNHNTWYAHMFRTQGGDFSFPWPNKGKDVQITKRNVKKLIWDYKIKNQKYPVSWLIDRFYPVPGWSDNDLIKLKEYENNL